MGSSRDISEEVNAKQADDQRRYTHDIEGDEQYIIFHSFARDGEEYVILQDTIAKTLEIMSRKNFRADYSEAAAQGYVDQG